LSPWCRALAAGHQREPQLADVPSLHHGNRAGVVLTGQCRHHSDARPDQTSGLKQLSERLNMFFIGILGVIFYAAIDFFDSDVISNVPVNTRSSLPIGVIFVNRDVRSREMN